MNFDEHDSTAQECLDLETLAAMADGLLNDPERSRAEAHAAACGSCRATLRDLVGTFQEQAAPAPAPAGLADRIVSGLPGEQPQTSGGSMLRFRLPIAAAAILVAALGVAFWMAHADRGPVLVEEVAPGPVLVGALPMAEPAAPGSAVVPKRPAELGGPERYLAHLSTDKPVYRPGEVVRARAVLLDAFTRKPLRGEGQAGLVQVKGARGQILHQAATGIRNGVAGIEWQVPANQVGGTFSLVASFSELGLGETSMDFDVRDYRVPRLKTDLQFLQKAYGPGDEVRASLQAERAEGGFPAGAAVTAIARLDGAEVERQTLRLDAAGRCDLRFRLPASIENGIGTLAVRVEDGGVIETSARTLPIVLERVDLAFYPEGGELIAGVPCGLYFEARTPRQEPADVAGVIVDESGAEIARFASLHEGRGRTMFTPAYGRTYRAVLQQPAGIIDPIVLPVVKGGGVSLRASRARFDQDEPITVALASTKDQAVTVGLYVRERELTLRSLQLPAGEAVQVELTPEEQASGVLRVTVFDDAGSPLAERLVLRRPRTELQLQLTPSETKILPGGHVEVGVRALDRHGRPVPGAVVGVAATDDAVLATVDPRERAPRLPVQALLGAEVQELRDVTRYLGGDAASASRADLLLGTQGWRRFCFQDPEAFRKQQGEIADRVLAWRNAHARWWGVRFNAWDGVSQGGGGGGHVVTGDDAPVAMADAPWLDDLTTASVDDPGAAPTAAAPEAAAPVASGQSQTPSASPEPTPVIVEDPIVTDLDVPEVVLEEFEPMADPALDDLPPAEPEPRGGLAGDAWKLRLVQPMQWHREYAHRADAGREPGARKDFTETVYWNVGLVTDDEGRATFSFDASDAVTTLRIRADAFDREGGLAQGDALIEVKRPFYTEPKFPLEVSAGDSVLLPIALVNGTDQDLPLRIRVEASEGIAQLNSAAAPTRLRANSSLRHRIPLRVHDFQGTVQLRVRVEAGPYRDDVTREIRVVMPGFPIEHAFGGVLEGVAQHEVEVPESMLPGSLSTEIVVYPTPLASMAEALAAMLREPHGCFEQTSSTNYPNVMAMQYMESHQGVDPAFLAKAAGMLERGYQRLVGFECPKRGYEWFGADPGHAELTAYGVLEFHDMSKVMRVDAEMLRRTRQWLLDRRDGEGSFQQQVGAHHGFGRAPQGTSNAYILWALAEAGESGLEVEERALQAHARTSQDPYVLALAANVAWLRGEHAPARRLLARLMKRQAEDGSVPGAQTSITGSGGRSLLIETTALAVLAWLRTGEHARPVEAAMRWMSGQCQGGRFGSTQATILALKAVIAYDASRAQVKVPGTLILRVDGEVLHEMAFAAGRKEALVLPDLGGSLGTGSHTLQLEMKGGGVMPYSMVVRYNAMTPVPSAQALVEVRTSLAQSQAVEGEPVEVRAIVRNRSPKGQPMAVAIIGLPGGLEARAAQLKELVKEGRVDAVETRGREVILYWRSLAPRATHEVTIDCVAAIPGTYEGPASRAYLYYTDEDKVWIPGMQLEIQSK